MTLLRVALVVLLASSGAFAQDVAPVTSPTPVFGLRANGLDLDDLSVEPEPLPPVGYVRAVVRPTSRLTRRVFVVLDVSGSMNGVLIQRAMRLVGDLLSSPVDDYELAIVAFNDNSVRWPGLPEPEAHRPVPEGWARFPSKDAADAAMEWLSVFQGDGGTDPCAALDEAMREDCQDLSVLLVTDGMFKNGPEAAMKTFDRALDDRRVVFMVYGVGPDAERREHLSRMGRDGGGGFWVDAETPKADDKSFR